MANTSGYSLGVDIGTTSVKVCIYNSVSNELIAKQAKDTQANVPSDQGSEGDKQDVPKIISALHSCMSRLPRDALRQVKIIGVCGQMHGVLLWQKSDSTTAWEKVELPNSNVKFEVARNFVSNLYTWQDSRCDENFLRSLPVPESHISPSTGFGCSTLFWFAKNRPEKLKKFNCSGTIQDFAVAMLCDLSKPVMSWQNAASWGYFNATKKSWNTAILEQNGLPTTLLPDLVKPRSVAGFLSSTWFGIPQGTPIGAAFGDFQCSVLSTVNAKSDAALNISTSAQIAFIMDHTFEPMSYPEKKEIEYIPYFDDHYLAVAASLNGGNTLAAFVKMLQQWTLDLGFSVPQAKVWEKVTELGSKETAVSNVEIVPTLLGERHAPAQNASASNIDPGSLGLGQIFRALCKGVVTNLHSMIPADTLKANKIEKIIGSGSALTRNEVLRKLVEECYSLPVEFVSGRGACLGAALAMSEQKP